MRSRASAWPEISALIGVVVFGFFGEKFRAQLIREVVPAMRAQYGAIHFIVQIAKVPDRFASFVELVEAVVGFGHAVVVDEVCWISASSWKSHLAQESVRQVVTIRTVIYHCYRLNIVAAQQDCKRPFSFALCADVGRSDHNSSTAGLAYAPRSVLNLMLGGPRCGRHGLEPPKRGWDDQKPEKTTRSRKSG
jgi:hypothetical protein